MSCLTNICLSEDIPLLFPSKNTLHFTLKSVCYIWDWFLGISWVEVKIIIIFKCAWLNFIYWKRTPSPTSVKSCIKGVYIYVGLFPNSVFCFPGLFGYSYTIPLFSSLFDIWNYRSSNFSSSGSTWLLVLLCLFIHSSNYLVSILRPIWEEVLNFSSYYCVVFNLVFFYISY